MNALQKTRRVRPRGVESAACGCSLQREAHLDIRGTECIAREPGRSGKFEFHVVQVLSNLVYGLEEHQQYVRELEA